MLLGLELKFPLLSITGLSPSRVQNSTASSSKVRLKNALPQRRLKKRFRLLPFRSPLLRESLLLFFPLATKMFQFTRLSLIRLWIQR
jgi:hypothetical protein